MLSNYFVSQRLEFGLYGLYPKYRLHVQPIAVFLSLISHTYIITSFHSNVGTCQDQCKLCTFIGNVYVATYSRL